MTMRSTLIALATISALAAIVSMPAAAADRPVCLHGAQTGGVWDCSYESIAQCNATLSGTPGACDVNPVYIAHGYNPANAYAQQYSAVPRRGYRSRRYYNGY